MNLQPVSPNLIRARLVSMCITQAVIAVLIVVVAVLWHPWVFAALGLVLVAVLWQLWLIPRQVRAIGWQETADELVIAKGKLWRTVTVVPYGRIQFVDVEAGPIDRWAGIKQVMLHTASATSDTSLPGLLADDADALRDRLAVQARERMYGL